MTAGYLSSLPRQPTPSSSSWLTHSTQRPHLFNTDNEGSKAGEGENQVTALPPASSFRQAAWGNFLRHRLLVHPPRPSSLSPEMRDTSNFTPSLLFPPPLWHRLCDRPFLNVSGNSSFCQGHGWWRHSYSSVEPQFLPLLPSDICFLSLKKKKKGGKAFDSSNQRTERTKQKQFRGADEKLLLCHTGSSFRNKVRTCFEHQLTISDKHLESCAITTESTLNIFRHYRKLKIAGA